MQILWNEEQQSPVFMDEVFDKKDLTIEELMDHELYLNELKQLNPKLIQFVSQKEVMAKLIDYIIYEHSDPNNQKMGFKYPFIASETLDQPISAIHQVFIQDWKSNVNDEMDIPDERGEENVQSSEDEKDKQQQNTLLNRLFGFISVKSQLNYTLSGYFWKVVSKLMNYHTPEMVEFLYSNESYFVGLLRQLDNDSIRETLKRVLFIEQYIYDSKNEDHSQLKIRVINKLLEIVINPSSSSSCFQQNAAIMIIDLIQRHSKLWDGIKMMEVIYSRTKVDCIMQSIQSNPSNQHLLNIIKTVIIINLPPNFKSQQEQMLYFQNKKYTESYFMEQLGKSLNQAKSILSLQKNPKQAGQTRVIMVDLISFLIRLNTETINQVLITEQMMEEVFDNFIYFSENNFLHNAVDRMVQEIVTRGSDEILTHLMDGVAVQSRLMKMNHNGWPDNIVNTHTQSKGYLGHVHKISNYLENCYKIDIINQRLTANQEWRNYVQNVLKIANERNTIKIGEFYQDVQTYKYEDQQVQVGLYDSVDHLQKESQITQQQNDNSQQQQQQNDNSQQQNNKEEDSQQQSDQSNDSQQVEQQQIQEQKDQEIQQQSNDQQQEEQPKQQQNDKVETNNNQEQQKQQSEPEQQQQKQEQPKEEEQKEEQKEPQIVSQQPQIVSQSLMDPKLDQIQIKPITGGLLDLITQNKEREQSEEEQSMDDYRQPMQLNNDNDSKQQQNERCSQQFNSVSVKQPSSQEQNQNILNKLKNKKIRIIKTSSKVNSEAQSLNNSQVLNDSVSSLMNNSSTFRRVNNQDIILLDFLTQQTKQ